MSSDSLRRLKWGEDAPQPEAIDEVPTVLTTGNAILKGNPNRVQAFLGNVSAFDIVVRWGDRPTTTLGYLVEAGGGKISFSYEDDGERIFGPLQAIAVGGNAQVFVTSDVMPAARIRKVA